MSLSIKTPATVFKLILLLGLALCWALILAGCVSSQLADPIDPKIHPRGTTYRYQPLNPTTVWIRDPTEEEVADGWSDADETSYEFNKALLRDLDTETVRIAMDTLDGSASLSAGVVGASVKGQSYVLIVDYIKYITSNQPIDTHYFSYGEDDQEHEEHFNGAVPIYTGIGLRIRAEFKATESGLNISGLPALAIAASVNGISGRLTVQTLGITGPEITALMPILSDISVSSIQSAVQAVGAIKAKIYEDSTTVYPKIVGFESPRDNPELIRAIAGALYATELWVCPVVIKNPEDPAKKIHWINWFSSPPEDEEPVEEE